MKQPAVAVKPAVKPPVTPPTATPTPLSPNGTTPVQFEIDFSGNGLEDIPAGQPPDVSLTCTPPLTADGTGTVLRESKVEKQKDNSWRVTFTIIPLKHFVPTQISCLLTRSGQPLTETWSYTWHQ